jgi:multiple antibiotic resistance protein
MMEFWLCFVPLFVAVDALGVLPIYMSMVGGLAAEKVRRVLRQSVATAMLVALLFLFGGSALLRMLGITVHDFMIAGGSLLFVISMNDLVRTAKTRLRVDPDSVGAVPIGVPLITGPAVLTTSVLLLNEHRALIAAVALAINVLLAGVIFHFGPSLSRVLGRSGSKTLSKIASLLLTAIAVMMIRKGLMGFLVSPRV